MRLFQAFSNYATAPRTSFTPRVNLNEFAETTFAQRILRYVVKGALEMNRSRVVMDPTGRSRKV